MQTRPILLSSPSNITFTHYGKSMQERFNTPIKKRDNNISQMSMTNNKHLQETSSTFQSFKSSESGKRKYFLTVVSRLPNAKNIKKE